MSHVLLLTAFFAGKLAYLETNKVIVVSLLCLFWPLCIEICGSVWMEGAGHIQCEHAKDKKCKSVQMPKKLPPPFLFRIN